MKMNIGWAVAAVSLLAAGCGVNVATPCIPDGGGDMNGCHTPPPSPDLWHNTEADSCEGKLLCEYDDAKPDGKQCPFVKFGSEGNYALLEQCAKNRECKDKCESIIGGRPVPLTKECKACIRSHAADGVFHFVCDYCK